jgi:hypothetical protein
MLYTELHKKWDLEAYCRRSEYTWTLFMHLFCEFSCNTRARISLWMTDRLVYATHPRMDEDPCSQSHWFHTFTLQYAENIIMIICRIEKYYSRKTNSQAAHRIKKKSLRYFEWEFSRYVTSFKNVIPADTVFHPQLAVCLVAYQKYIWSDLSSVSNKPRPKVNSN